MFDMNQCKNGDKLITGRGEIVTYLGKDKSKDYMHQIKYQEGLIGTRTNEGFFLKNSDNLAFAFFDIIGFAEDAR